LTLGDKSFDLKSYLLPSLTITTSEALGIKCQHSKIFLRLILKLIRTSRFLSSTPFASSMMHSLLNIKQGYKGFYWYYRFGST